MRTLSAWSWPLLALAALALPAAPASAVEIEWVFVGDPGNPPDTSTNCNAVNCGSVPYAYSIAKFEVTNAQYAEFLNTKAAADPLGLYNTLMGSAADGGITRGGTIGSYQYTAKPGFANKPVNFVSFWDALRFINWLGNGQGGGDTEDGAYTLLGGTPTPSNGASVVFNRGTIFLPSENEWYKAAYYDGRSATYFEYPTGTNATPVCAAPTATANRANCQNAVGDPTDVGAYTGSASPYGTFDQGGNVEEWNERPGIRGGRYSGVAFASGGLSLSAKFRLVGNSAEATYLGFRVASLVPEPEASPLAMIVLAGLAARQRRSRRRA